MHKAAALTITLALLGATASPTSAPPRPEWTLKARQSALSHVERALNDYYYVQRIPEIRAALEARRASLLSIDSAKAFAAAVTVDLQDASHDKHFLLSYLPVADNNLTPRYSPGEVAKLRQFFRYVDNGFDTTARLKGNVGYLRLSGFGNMPQAKATLDAAMALVADTGALIIDLRGNQGGDSDTVDYLVGYFFAKPVEIAQTTTRIDGRFSVHREYSSRSVSGARYLGRPVYVLVNGQTISAGEMFAYSLQSLRRATVVGARTAGAANGLGSPPYYVGPHLRISIPNTRIIDPRTHGNWEDGVRPDVTTVQTATLLYAYRRALHDVPKTYDPLGELAAAIANPVEALQESLSAP